MKRRDPLGFYDLGDGYWVAACWTCERYAIENWPSRDSAQPDAAHRELLTRYHERDHDPEDT